MMNARTTALLALDLAESRRVRGAIATSAPWIPVPRIWTLDGHNAAREISQPVDYALPEGAVVYVSAGVQRTPAAKFLAAVQRENGDDIEFRNLDRDGHWDGWERERPEQRRDVVEQGEAPDRPTGPAPLLAEPGADDCRHLAWEQSSTGRPVKCADCGAPLPDDWAPEEVEAIADLVEQGVDVVEAVEAVTAPGPDELAEAAIADALNDDRLENLGGVDFAQTLRDVLAENGWRVLPVVDAEPIGEPETIDVDDADELAGLHASAGHDQPLTPEALALHRIDRLIGNRIHLGPSTLGQVRGIVLDTLNTWHDRQRAIEAHEENAARAEQATDPRKAVGTARPEPTEVATWIYVRGAGWWPGPWHLAAGEAVDDVGTRVDLAGVSARSSVPLDGTRDLPGGPR